MKFTPITINQVIAQLQHIKHLFGDGTRPLYLVGKEEEFCSFMPISRIEPIGMPLENDETKDEPVAALFGFDDEEAFDLPPNLEPPPSHLKVVKK